MVPCYEHIPAHASLYSDRAERQLVQRVALSRLTTAGVWPKIGLLSRCVQKWDARVVVVVTRMVVLQ